MEHIKYFNDLNSTRCVSFGVEYVSDAMFDFYTQAVARSVARPSTLQMDPITTPTSGTFFREDLVMKTVLLPLI